MDADEQDYYLRLKKSWKYMQKVYENLNQHYVEEVDPYPLIKAGIDGMLEKLDPYTVFLEEDGERRLQIITTGKYGGLGMEIGLRNKKVTVIAPIDNTPAKKMGIQAGDIRNCLTDAYSDSAFIRICTEGRIPDTLHVRGTNYCDIGFQLDKRSNRLIIISAIDNLVKGAAGQAVQNMNIMLGLDETAGLSHIPYPL